MGVESSKVTCGAVRKHQMPGRAAVKTPPQEPPMVSCGSMRSSDVSVTSMGVPPMGSELESEGDPIWVIVSHTITKGVKFVDRAQVQQPMEDIVSSLIDAAKEKMCEKAKSLGCNAVLGMTFNISKDPVGERCSSRSVLLTMLGTPCVLSHPRHPSFSPTLTVINPATGNGGTEDTIVEDECTTPAKLQRRATKRVSLTYGPPPLSAAAMKC